MYDARLITPPKEEEEVYPYRRVWRSIVFVYGALLLLSFAFFVLVNFVGVTFPEQIRWPMSLGFALLPALFWGVSALLPERFVNKPRQDQLKVFVITALAANAIGVPFVDQVMRVEEWLPLAGAIDRIVGYTFAIGIVQEFLKYLALRYTVWPDQFRVRIDGLAYAEASAAGYALILNLHYVFNNVASPDVIIARIFATSALHLVTSAIMAYGLSETRFSRPLPILLPVTLFLAALVTGLSIPLRAGLVNANLEITISTVSPLLGLLFSTALLIGPLVVIAFLMNTASRRVVEADME